jgi:tRNA dimethylallyltransferase
MNLNSPRAFVLVGPTASGKSAVSQLLAEKTGAAIISADSMNIYRGMDIGTAKPSLEERTRVKTFGIDLTDPTEVFSVGDWLRDVCTAWGQSKHCSNTEINDTMFRLTPLPIVAGGTGLYVKCLLQGLDDLPTADEALRERMERMTLVELQAEAQQVAPVAYELLADKNNPRRLIRLLEKKESRNAVAWKTEIPVVIGLHVERDVLHRRIAERVGKMYADGLLEESRGLADIKLSSTARQAIGYAEAFAVLRGEMTQAQAIEKTIIRTRQLAKRQMTWFRHQLNVQWVETSDYPSIGKLADKVYNVFEERGPVSLAGICL